MQLNYANFIRALLPALLAASVVASGCGGTGEGGDTQPLSVTCPASVVGWVPNTTYATGDIVSFNGTKYRCVQGHTALDNWQPDIVPALWEPVQCSSGGATPPSGGGNTGGTGGGTGGGT